MVWMYVKILHFETCLALLQYKRNYHFLFRVNCDADGWTLAVNKEPLYPTFFHILPLSEVTNVQIIGDITVR